MLDSILWWSAVVLVGVLALLMIAPFIRTGQWFVRMWDFPRLQLAALTVVPAIPLLVLIARNAHVLESMIVLGLLVIMALWGLALFLPYSRFWRKDVGDLAPAGNGSTITFLVANICYESDQYREMSKTIAEAGADVLLLIEVNDTWRRKLEELSTEYEHRIEDISGEGLGLALWSKLPLKDSRIDHIIEERRPSIFADIELPDGREINFVGLHPTPPGLRDSTGEERRDSRVRDGELVLLAKYMAEQPRKNWVVAGDFNDVAWSHTTRLFRRLSGLLDPRIGRALLNTYHAAYPLLRYPVDHLFVAPGFAIGGLERVRLPGSDHFGVLGKLHLEPLAETESADPEDDAEDREEAAEAVEEGLEDVQERSVAVPIPGVSPI